jgi:mono/diheme cytochrome c family protein
MRGKTKEGLEVIVVLGLASLAAVLPLSLGAAPPVENPQQAQDEREARVVRGGRMYEIYCASCHGTGAEGNGPMAQALKGRPADLTQIRQRNGGSFPADRVAAFIDGCLAARGHGPGSMPVWGLSFRIAGEDQDQERQVKETIRDLVSYLESIQE